MKSTYRTTKTEEEQAKRRAENAARRKAAVARIETALPRVLASLRPDFEDILKYAAKRHPADLEWWAGRAEGWRSEPELSGEQLAAAAAQDQRDLMGP